MKVSLHKIALGLLASLAFALLFTGCSNTSQTQVELGKEFSLAIGQSVAIKNENLTIRFDAVTEDSRCPTGATCIWAGQASARVTINDGSATELTLTEPGLTDNSNLQVFKQYQLDFKILPYPKLGEEISQDEYRLVLTVTKL